MFQTGLDVCLEEPPEVLRSGRFGLLMNQASITGDWRYACDALAARFPGRLAAIFSPQHGLWSEQQANMIESPHTIHPRLKVPVYSLYSETRKPTAEMLRDLDVFVVDLQDVGTRVYTFIWTISHCLEACVEKSLPVIVLDRPNPIGGELLEGEPLDPEFRSFVGRACIPMRHGLTIGELSRVVNEQLQIGARLYVVSMHGWKRSLWFDDLNRPWIPPSPNLPRVESCVVYPGQVLLEGTNLSEGRGTTRPFEVVGAPFIDAEQFCDTLTAFALPGIRFLPMRFVPTFDKWKFQSCSGVSLHVTDRAKFRSLRTTVAILAAARSLYPNDFTWLPPPYEYETVKMPIDILFGNSQLRETLDRNSPIALEKIDEASLTTTEANWRAATKTYHLYQ